MFDIHYDDECKLISVTPVGFSTGEDVEAVFERGRADFEGCPGLWRKCDMIVDLSSSMPLPREAVKRIEDFVRDLGASALRKPATIGPQALRRVQARHLVKADELYPCSKRRGSASVAR